MFDIIKSAISAGGYKLTEIQHKIKKLYFLGDLTEAQMDELLALASLGVSTDAERPETIQMIRTLADEVKKLAERVAALESTVEEEEDPEAPVDPEQPEQTEQIVYPEWKPWDGISKDYQYDAIVSHNGELWQSKFNGQNVWEPGAPGTDALWVKYTPEVQNG